MIPDTSVAISTAELQIRGGVEDNIEDNLKIIFLIAQLKHTI